MCVGEVGNAISEFCVRHATENVLVNGSAEPLWGHTGLGKRQMDEAQKQNIFRHVQTKKCV